jgi:hypothetical protein
MRGLPDRRDRLPVRLDPRADHATYVGGRHRPNGTALWTRPRILPAGGTAYGNSHQEDG